MGLDVSLHRRDLRIVRLPERVRAVLLWQLALVRLRLQLLPLASLLQRQPGLCLIAERQPFGTDQLVVFVPLAGNRLAALTLRRGEARWQLEGGCLSDAAIDGGRLGAQRNRELGTPEEEGSGGRDNRITRYAR